MGKVVPGLEPVGSKIFGPDKVEILDPDPDSDPVGPGSGTGIKFLFFTETGTGTKFFFD
jgi:hypothetical protein